MIGRMHRQLRDGGLGLLGYGEPTDYGSEMSISSAFRTSSGECQTWITKSEGDPAEVITSNKYVLTLLVKSMASL